MWPSLEKNFKDASIVKLPANAPMVYSLHVDSSFDGVLVTFADGTCQSVADSNFEVEPAFELAVASANPTDELKSKTKGRGKGKRRRVDTDNSDSVVWSELLREQKTGSTKILAVMDTASGPRIQCHSVEGEPGNIKSTSHAVIGGPEEGQCVSA